MIQQMKRGQTALAVGVALAAIGAAGLTLKAPPASAKGTACHGDNGGLTLSPGFCATLWADNLGHVRHLAQAPDGTIYVNTWSGVYFVGSPPPPGGFLVALKDSKGTGKADQITRFGDTVAQGDAGGSGIAIYKGAVYAEMNDKIVKYALGAGGSVPTGKADVVLSGMPLGGDHPMHPFIIDPKGQIFVDMGTATNACQAENRKAGVPGADPCTEKETRGGTWKYDANKLGQTFSAAERYATGLRNGEGFAFDSAGRLFVTQHGRDQLPANWPKLYPDLAHATELPSEELVMETKGADFGWPNCYYDGFQKKLVLAPEYGGDGGKAVGACANKQAPVAAFPAHWGPNDLAIYGAKAFPAPYQGGAVIGDLPDTALDVVGDVERAIRRDQQAGGAVFGLGRVAFAAREAVGEHHIMAGRLAVLQGLIDHVVAGLLVAADGALYISDDVKGRIWKVTYHGPAGLTKIAAAPAPKMVAASAAASQGGGLPTPPGATPIQVAAGDQLYHTQSCVGCHGADAKGTPVGPDLTSGKWLWGDGSLAALKNTIANGVAAPKQYRSPMPAKGGAQLSDSDLDSMTAYVWAVGHQGK